jgi:hypothetical protein
MLQTARALLETVLETLNGVDIDSPIPYEITAKGYRYLDEREKEEREKTE